MTDKQLKKLNKSELLELLLLQTQENERLQKELEETQRRLMEKTIYLQQAGSIAEASLRINHIFEDAQKAADQYVYSVKKLTDYQRQKSGS